MRRLCKAALGALLATTVAVGAGPSASAAGSGGQLQSTTGTGGLALTPSGDQFFDSVTTPDLAGGLYVVGDGASGDAASGSATVFHFTSPGVLDTAYPDPVLATDEVGAATVDPTGRLYVLYAAAGSETHADLARFTSAGALDTTFGTGGVLTGLLVSNTQALTTDATHVYVGGGATIQAFNANGTADTTFGAGGTVTLEAGAEVEQLVIQGGDIYVVDDAYNDQTQNPQARLVRLDAAGTLDTTFGHTLDSQQDFAAIGFDGSGLLYAQIDNYDPDTGIAINMVSRLTSTGATDTAYGAAGVVTLPESAAQPSAPGGSDEDVTASDGLLVASDGSLYAQRDDAYYTDDDQTTTIDVGTVTRVTAAGALDPTFGTNGVTALTGTATNPFTPAVGSDFAQTGDPVLLSNGGVAVAGVVNSGQIGVGQLTTSTAPGRFVPAAHRLADSRSSSSGFERPDLVPVVGPFSGTAITHTTAAVPSDATAVSLEVSVVAPAASGYLRVTSGYGVASTTSVNFTKGISQTVLVSTPVASDGRISVTVVGTSNVVVDQLGYDDQTAPAGGQMLTAIAPTRAVDTRSGIGTPAGPKNGLFTVTLPTAVPAGATAVLNVTATTPTATGYLQLDPHAGTPTTAVNYVARASATALAYTTTDSNDRIDVTTHGSTQVVIDVIGYLTPVTGNVTTPGQFVSVPASRIVDSRSGLGAATGPRTGAINVTVPTALVPADATGVLLNITAISPTASSYATLKATGGTSTATILNVTHGQSLTALAITALNTTTSQITITFNGFSANLVVDVIGYYN